MPKHARSLALRDVESYVAEHVFDPHPDGRIGIELEWLAIDAGDLGRRLSMDEITSVLGSVGPLPRSSRLSIEPGGQIELSTLPFPDTESACEAAGTDLYRLDLACNRAGVDLVALGADPLRDPERVVGAPRYTAMQSHFDQRGPAGRTMMCNTASIQLNVGLGSSPEEVSERWQLANALGPTLTAAFSNSPLARGGPTGWQSTRLQAWWSIDPSRTRPVPLGTDPVVAWYDYALDANVMLIRLDDNNFSPVAAPFPFRAWIEQGHELGWPTIDDLDYHLTTLFPPVRPRGWFEIRVFDALPTPFWNVAVAVTTALLEHADTRQAAREAVAGTEDLWIDSAQLALAHPALARAARSCFELALETLPSIGSDEATSAVVATYHDRWISRGRCPADDRLDDWRRDGTLFPRRESPLPYGQLLHVEDP
jgi:glutamate--cysteine ligase